eukprot:4814282-Prymnesium_polylepis.1
MQVWRAARGSIGLFAGLARVAILYAATDRRCAEQRVCAVWPGATAGRWAGRGDGPTRATPQPQFNEV